MGLGSWPFGTMGGMGSIPFGTAQVLPASEQLQFIRRAATLLRVQPSDLQIEFEHWMGGGFDTYGPAQMDGSGTVVFAADLGGGGWKRHSTGTTNPTLTYITGNTKPLPRVDTSVGYVRRRVIFETAYDANDVAFFGLQNNTSNGTMGIGFIGSMDAVNVIFQYDGNLAGSHLDLFVLDTAIHVIEMWWLGDGIVHVAVDEVEIGSGVTPAAPITTVMHTFDLCTNGATGAVDRRMADDYIFLATV